MSSVLKAPEVLTTARLLLRRPVLSNVDAIFRRYASDRVNLRFIGWPAHESALATRSFLEFSDTEWRSWPAGPYLILSRSGEQLVGGTGLAFESANSASTGYVLARDSWGKGFATEALVAMVELARGLRVRRLSAICHISHTPSQRVLEKAGFIRESTLPGHQVFPNLDDAGPQDAFLYVTRPYRE